MQPPGFHLPPARMLLCATRLELPSKPSIHLRLWLSRWSCHHPLSMPSLLTGQGSSSLTTQPLLAPILSLPLRRAISFPQVICTLVYSFPSQCLLDIYTFGFSDRSLLDDTQGRHCSPSQGCPWEVAKEWLIMQSDNQPCSLKLFRLEGRKGAK